MLETLREFIKQTPVLANMIERELLNNPGNFTNTEDLRYHVEKLQSGLMAKLKAERKLYAVVHFPEQEIACPICKETSFGYYWELNNPVTGKGLCVSNRMVHALVAHEQFFINESMQTVAGTRVGETRLVLDFEAFAGVLKGADVDPVVASEVEEARALQARALEEAGAFVASGGH